MTDEYKRPHIDANGNFQSDKYPSCPPGKVPLSVKDPTAQDLLWEYAQRRRSVDAEFADDLEFALVNAGYDPSTGIEARGAELERAATLFTARELERRTIRLRDGANLMNPEVAAARRWLRAAALAFAGAATPEVAPK